MAENIQAQIAMLTAKKQSLFQLMQNMHTLSSDMTSAKTRKAFLTKTISIEKTRQEFIEVMDRLNLAILSQTPKGTPDYSSLLAFDELYCLVVSVVQDVQVSTKSTRPSDIKEESSSFHKRLPPLEIMSFDGTPSKWVMFYENFTSIVHNNKSLSNAEKVQYLVGKLSGKALTVCAGIPPVADNYEIIWNALVEKFQDKRTLATHYLDQMFNFNCSQQSSVQSLDSFIEKFASTFAALKQLKIKDLADFIVTYLAMTKLDRQTLALFEQANRNESLPSFEQLIKFIKEQSKILSLHNILPPPRNKMSDGHQQSKAGKSSTHSFFVSNAANKNSNAIKCPFCKEERKHYLYKCEAFLKQDVGSRLDFVKCNNLCYNCLGFHQVNNCRSHGSCVTCHRKHHSLLHIAKNNVEGRTQTNSNAQTTIHATPAHLAAHSSTSVESSSRPLAQCGENGVGFERTHSSMISTDINNYGTILPTAVVFVYNKTINEYVKIRVFLDSGSTANFITKSCCDKLNLKINYASSSVKGIGLVQQSILGFTNITICSRFDPRCRYALDARVLNVITDRLPYNRLRSENLTHFRGLPLADEYFCIPAEIDMLIGSEIFPLLLNGGAVSTPDSNAIALHTKLGYVIMGKAQCIEPSVKDSSACAFHVVSEPCLETLTQRFWELESVPSKVHLSRDEENCEKDFVNNFSRDVSGRYIVRLPFKVDPSALGDSKVTATTRLLRLEKRLKCNAAFREGYNATIQEYINQGYLTKVVEHEPSSNSYYIPHHAVYRPDKTTSKIRIVLDASCKTTSGYSLNDILYAGPNLQANIFDLLLNLRLFEIAISADIEKMYFRIKLAPENHCFQRILFRFDDNAPIDTYQFNCVSFGISSSAYLALRVVRQLAQDERKGCPIAAAAAEKFFYMDDFVSSVSSLEDAKQLYHELTRMFSLGGFKLTKWISSSTSLLEYIPSEMQSPDIRNFDENITTKVIGIQWRPVEDAFFFEIHAENLKCTKRNILSVTARLFDPLSLTGPVVALLKLLVQECWKSGLGWDEDAPDYICNQWQRFQDELPLLKEIKIPRHIGIFDYSNHVTLVGFADASESCYGAVIYLRVGNHELGNAHVSLLCSKSRVAPLKNVTLARLELSAALLLANLMAAVKESISSRVSISQVTAFSDSTVALAWIGAQPYRFQTFVANRIAAINDALPAKHWHHIAGENNPADIISRPITPANLVGNDMWFSGPSFLRMPFSQWPTNALDSAIFESNLPESKVLAFSVNTNACENIVYAIANRFSKWIKFLRSFVFILRFVKKLSSRSEILVSDLEYAENFVIKTIQTTHYAQEINAIKENKPASLIFRKLNAFIDDSGILRVGGRLRNAQIEYNQRHPAILPAKDKIVQMLVSFYHVSNLHAGASLLIALIRQKYWLLSARCTIRRIVQQCNICFRLNPKSSNPIMADLPRFRVSKVKAFVYTGVDYGGPYFVTPYRRRGAKTTKAYICLFICLTTKALHLELVSDLSTDLFLAAFKRFISRRGPVSMILSDGGTNFIGAKRKLGELFTLLKSNEHNQMIQRNLTDLKIEFRINPPLSPHFGGIWESNIKSVKTHLARVIGNQILTYEEFNTILVQVEGLMNSRPLCVLSSDPAESQALTPAHFLNVTPLKYLPSENMSDIPDNRLSRYQLLDKLIQSYWKRWSTEYLTSLQVRAKWNTQSKPVKVGDVVIIREDNSPPLSWPIGTIEELFPGKDGVIRVVKVKTCNGTYMRPVVRLCPLPLQ